MAVRHPEIADHAQLRAWHRAGKARLHCSFATAHAFMGTPMVGRKARKAYYRRLLGWHASWPAAPLLGWLAGQALALPVLAGVLAGGWWLRGKARAMAIEAATAAALADEAAYELLNVDGGLRVELVAPNSTGAGTDAAAAQYAEAQQVTAQGVKTQRTASEPTRS